MASFSVRFLGCKVSQLDAEGVREALVRGGHREVERDGDVAVVNTCCVTHEAVRKSRQAATRAARSHARVYVTGCGANLEGEAFAGLPPNVVVVRRPSEAAPAFVAGDVGAIGCVGGEAPPARTRAFVKIQDGCSFSCRFCVIPLVRGGTRSRSAAAILDDVRRRVAAGQREVVLTGINLGLFRHGPYRLPRLVREVAAVPGLLRVRLSSIEVNHVDDELVGALRGTPSVGRHLHVPLQSGDDDVLRAMGRRYTVARYLARLERLGDFNLTTDVIVGFPGEDERAFERTLDTVERAGITKVHVFPYSPRPGTATAASDTVAPEVKRERGRRLRAWSDAASRAHWETWIGKDDEVLIDRPGRGYGHDYTPWFLEGPVGAFRRVRAAGVVEEGIRAA